MCKGATRGLAILKFSTSPSMLGEFEIRVIIIIIERTAGSRSLIEKRGLNFILSLLEFVFEGFEDPFSCSRIRWVMTSTDRIIGRRKWSEKNRFRVGLSTAGPPQIHVSRVFPTSGMADSTPVITVAPQKDICPHGRTYPKKAVAMVIRRITTPEIHTVGWLEGELKYIPRAVWMYRRMKNREAPLV